LNVGDQPCSSVGFARCDEDKIASLEHSDIWEIAEVTDRLRDKIELDLPNGRRLRVGRIKNRAWQILAL